MDTKYSSSEPLRPDEWPSVIKKDILRLRIHGGVTVKLLKNKYHVLMRGLHVSELDFKKTLYSGFLQS